jgi:hypothetical protein
MVLVNVLKVMKMGHYLDLIVCTMTTILIYQIMIIISAIIHHYTHIHIIQDTITIMIIMDIQNQNIIEEIDQEVDQEVDQEADQEVVQEIEEID